MEILNLDIAGVMVSFARCPPGVFDMGSLYGLPIETPVRKVTISEPFRIATTLVTQTLWERVMHGNPSRFTGSGQLPVDSVSYDDALAFCDAITQLSDHRFSLPTEAHWEYACRAGTTTEYFWGESAADASAYAWFDLTSRRQTHDVAQLRPNPWGLYDSVGNLWEWCADVWHGDYTDAPVTGEARQSGTDRQPRRCLRGGAWDMDVFRLRSAYRSCEHHNLGISRFGFRIVISDAQD